ncbi:hypothetical protein C9975_10340 [Thalassospira xiamenensis]|nr:hypothetical protein C9975_10340 [Thalassospira xiamenensis]
MKKLLLIIFIVLAGTIIKLIGSYHLTDQPFNWEEFIESMIFIAVITPIIAVVFYRKELKSLFTPPSK